MLPDEAGTVVNVFNEILNFKNPGGQTFVFNVALVRSSDKGATWTHGQPIRAAQLLTKAAFDPDQSGVRDPDTGDLVRTGDIIPEIAVDRNPTSPGFGNLYVVWQDARFSNNGDFSTPSLLIDEIAFSRSTRTAASRGHRRSRSTGRRRTSPSGTGRRFSQRSASPMTARSE